MFKQIHLNECHSTQDVLKEQITQVVGTSQILISCENQTQGHGRGQNSWTAMPGSLCFSMNIDPHSVPSFSALELSVLVAHFFQIKKADLKLKWPNDLLNEDGIKCAGILIQSHHGQMIAGIGVNIFSNKSEFGGVYSTPFEFSKKEYAHELGSFIHANRLTNTETLRIEWKKICAHMDSQVSLEENHELIKGQFKDLGPHGEAIILTNKAEEHHFNGTLRIL